MAEFVQQNIEDMLPELEYMERVQLFTAKETKSILKKRKAFEYRLRRKTKVKDDYIQYIQYEMDVLDLVKKRRHRMGYKHKRMEIDIPIEQRIHRLFRMASFRFQDDIKIWLSHIKFCKMRSKRSGHGAKALISDLYSRMLQVHTRRPALWIKSAKHEMEVCQSMDNARMVLQRGLRFNPQSKQLWLEYFRMELLNVEKLYMRKEVLSTAGLQTEDEVRDEVMQGKVAQVVYRTAVENFPDDVEFRLSFLPVCRIFPFAKEMEDTIFQDIQGVNSESTWHATATRHLYQIDVLQSKETAMDVDIESEAGGLEEKCFEVFEQAVSTLCTGITLVVSPLVSLMEDQLFALHKLAVSAKLLNASSAKEEVNSVHSAMTDKKADLKLLYVTPEKLAKSKRFMNKLEKMYEVGRFARLVIDEVHCCSQWGHDFRPDYKFLGIMRKQFPSVPILGLTATATSMVMEDVKKILNIKHCVVYRASFNRKNLYYEVRSKPSGGLKAAVDDIFHVIRTRFSRQPGIVYCFSQKDTEDVARELTSRGLRAACYHANLDPKYRSQVHSQWIANDIQVVVATIAFGMGIDKPDVRFVIHHSLSKSMENYYQESGRAGRDDKQAHCILYTSFQDVFRQSCMVFTEQTGLEKLHNMVQYGYSLNTCRRSLIARHFGENWEESQCNEMCDRCNTQQTGETVLKDMTSHCRNVVSTLLKHKGKTRLTGLKLMDAWLGRSSNAVLNRPDAERLIVHMLLEGYIREDFHFTAYSTISYLVSGPREYMLQRPDHTVRVLYRTKKSKATSIDSAIKSTTSNTSQKSLKTAESTPNLLPKSSTSSNSSQTSIKAEKSKVNATKTFNDAEKKSNTSIKSRNRGPCVVSAEHSKVTSGHFVHESQLTDSQESLKTESSVKSKKVKKRVIISDDSDTDLDFGEVVVTSKKSKKSQGNKLKEDNTNSVKVNALNERKAEHVKIDNGAGFSNGLDNECITLDSD